MKLKLKLGDRVEIDGIEMTCTRILLGVGVKRYSLLYFAGGECRSLEFDGGELAALGARKVERSAER